MLIFFHLPRLELWTFNSSTHLGSVCLSFFAKKNLFFSLKKSLFSCLCVCLGFLEKSFYQKNLF